MLIKWLGGDQISDFCQAITTELDHLKVDSINTKEKEGVYMSSARNKRINEEVKKIVSKIILFEIKDPRVSKLASVTHVDVTNDLRYVTIYISVFDPNHNTQQTIDGLNSAKGFIRKEIGKVLKLRYTPEPIFKQDNSIEHGMHINDIIGTLNIKHDEESQTEESDVEDLEDDEE